MGRLILAILMLASLGARAAGGDTALPLAPAAVIPGTYSNLYADNLQNLYLVAGGTSSIKKFNSRGDSVGVFNNMARYGRLYALDVSNPLRVLAYFKDFATIVVLDRFLSTRATINLRRQGMVQVKAIAQAYDGNIWLYDELEGRIKKIDESGNVLLQSADLRLVFDEALSPEKMIDNSGQLYLYDAGKGWLVFDYYTAFKKQLPFLHWHDVQVTDGLMSGRDKDQFFFATLKDIDYHTVPLPAGCPPPVTASWQPPFLYVLGKAGVYLYHTGPLTF